MSLGLTLDEIDTPALVLDLNAFDKNLDAMASHTAASGISLRPHAKAHKSPWIASQQVERGAVGLCCQKVSEAATFIDAGAESIVITNEIVEISKIRRMTQLALRADVSFCIDSADGLEMYDGLAAESGATLGVFVDLQGGWYRPGATSTEQVLDLAKRVAPFDKLRFCGLQAYNAIAQHIADFDLRLAATVEFCHRVNEAIDALNQAGLESFASGAGTGTYDIDPLHAPFNEIQPGSYVFMDGGYLENMNADGDARTDFEVSLYVLTTVMSCPAPGVAIVDSGTKTVSIGQGMPLVYLPNGEKANIEFLKAADEHGTIDVERHEVSVGDRLLLVPYNVDPTVNLFDEYLGLRDGVVTTVIPVSGRGKSQ